VKKLGLLAAALLLAACSKNIQNGEAVRQGVIDYLKTRTAQTGLDMNAMQVDVTSLAFEKDTARATVFFRPKNVPQGSGGMSMSYVLERKGDKWVVKGRQDSVANPHGMEGLPQSGPPADTPLPPGHPGVGATPNGALPPGHPPVSPK